MSIIKRPATARMAAGEDSRTRINAQAAAWISRLNTDDRTAAVDAACREWLNADPRHRAAFEIANRLWEDASTLPVSLGARIGRPLFDSSFVKGRAPRGLAPAAKKALRPLRWLTAAGVALGVLAGALLYLQRPPILETDTGQQLTVPLEDGSRLMLNTETRIRVRFDEQARRIELESGEALFDVAQDRARPFVVRAGDREITALGTQFVVRHDGMQTAVTLVDGKVSVNGDGVADAPPAVAESESRGAAVAILNPGERITIGPRRLMVVDRPSLEAVTAWRRGEIVFESTPLAQAIEEMNRYSVRKLRLGTLAAGNTPVSGLFRSGDAENFALALTTMHPLEAVEHGSQIEIRAR